MEYYLFGGGWNGFGITRDDGLEALSYSEGPKIMSNSSIGAPTPEFKIIEFKVHKIKTDNGDEYMVAIHGDAPPREEILKSIKR